MGQAKRPLPAVSWAAAARDVRRLALGLRSLGIEAGERVGLVSENRPEWVVADLAIMTAGAVTVPAYVTNTSRTIATSSPTAASLP